MGSMLDRFKRMLDLRALALYEEREIDAINHSICSSKRVQLVSEGREMFNDLCAALGVEAATIEFDVKGVSYKEQVVSYSGLEVALVERISA